MTAEPEPSPRRWGLRETAAAVGVAAVIAAFGGAAIYAATEGSSHSFGAPHSRSDQVTASPVAPVTLAVSAAPSAAPARPQWVQRRCTASSWYPTAQAATARC